MSVYSGFATRQQQSKYNSLLQNLVIALKKRLIKFYNNEECDEDKFKLLIKKIYKKMFLLEKGKFMIPKYSTCFGDLIEALKIQINYDSLSDASSMISDTFSLKKQQMDPESNQFKSRVILQTKRNLLTQNNNGIRHAGSSTFSLSKKFNTIGIENQEDIQHQKRSTSIGVANNIEPMKKKSRVKLRELKDLKQLRGTMHMPRVEDFLPKKQQIQPVGEHIFTKQAKRGFRRQKYSRPDISIQQI